MQKAPREAAQQQALKSRAEVQLLSALNQHKAKSASGYLRAEQRRVDDYQEQQQKRVSSQDLQQFRVSAGKNAAPPSEQDEMIAAVRQLEDHVSVFKPNAEDAESEDKRETLNQIELNAIRRREKHVEIQRVYTESVKTISEELELVIIKHADAIKKALAAVDDQLAVRTGDLTNDARLLACEHCDLLEMWTAMEQSCARRSKAVEAFSETLEKIEQERVERVRAGLQLLTKTLMDTAHALPPEVERIIEGEAYEVNVVVISNRRVYADLIARMATQDVDVLVRSRLQWEQGQERWRRLRHDEAIRKFHEVIDSTHFTDPRERGQVMEALRASQQITHSEKRIAALQTLSEAGADLTSQQAQRVLADLTETQREEDEANATLFSDLTRLHEEKLCEAQVLREALRLELHGFGALAAEGDIVLARDTLVKLLSDDSLEEFFRLAGGLKNDLDAIVKRLDVSELIYQAHLMPLRTSVGILLNALPLEGIMENQGKGAERKAVQATLDKMRKAAKHELVALLPSLQGQVVMLQGIADTSDVFQAELGDVELQLRLIMQEYETASPTDAEDASDRSSTPPGTTQATSPPAAATPRSPTPGNILTSTAFGTSSHTSLTSDASTGSTIELAAIRKVQRRLGALVYAAELSPAFQEHLAYVAKQLELQTHANEVVDRVVASSCDDPLAAREEESEQFVKLIGQRVQQQSVQLHDQCERLAKFYLQVAFKMEQGDDRVRFVNLSVLDLLDTLKDTDDEGNAALETQYSASCARLRHAPDSAVLQGEFTAATELLQAMEASYRLYQKRVALAAGNHVNATHKQRESFLAQQCALFGLVPPSASPQEPFDLEHFLSVKFIDDATLPKPPVVDNDATGENQQSSGEPSNQAGAGAIHAQQPQAVSGAVAQPEPTRNSSASADKNRKGKRDEATEPPKERFKTASGLELDFQLSIPDLVNRILEKSTDEDHEEKEKTQTSEKNVDPPANAMALPAASPPAEDTPPVEETASQVAAREARAARLRQVDDHVARDVLVLEVERSLQETLLQDFRAAILTKLDVTFKAHEASAAETQMQRLHECGLLLEERLRMHWPRKGRLDVQIYQPRIGELYSHRQRFDRHVRSMASKVESGCAAFDKLATTLQKYLEDARVKQLTLQAQLPLQQSLAALQGLEVKSKKLLSSCRVESAEMLDKLKTMTAADSALLGSMVQDYVRMCTAQVFPDLSSCQVISGCDFHPEEVAMIQSKLQSIEAKLRDSFDQRESSLAQLMETQRVLLESAQELKTRYQACMQSLSMKEGLGQKYGLPRRNAQEKYRSETTRADELSAKIDELLASLESVVVSKQTVKAPRLPESDVSTQVLHLLLRLRAMLYFRGIYFGLLKNVSQLEPIPVAFDAGGVASRPRFSDRDAVEEDYLSPPPKTFLDFVSQVATACRDETCHLYEQEGKLDELPQSGVPVALDDYLFGLDDKARAYVLHQELKYREQVDYFSELLALAPGAALHDLVGRARMEVSRSTVDVHEDMQRVFSSWMEQKNRNMVELRPDLCSPNNGPALQALCEREALRSEQTLVGLRECRAKILEKMVISCSDFEKELLALWEAFVTVLDTSVMTLEDLQPFSGEEPPKTKRKSLKRLRKLARIQEFGDPREAKRSEEEVKKLAQLKEVPRFPRRGWPAIPSFSLHVVWESKRAELAKEDAEMNAAVDALLASISVDQAVDGDGACTALLTHAHRCLVHSRDEVHAEFATFSQSHSHELLADLQKRLRDEVKWTENWQLGIEKIRRQTRSSARAPADAHSDQ